MTARGGRKVHFMGNAHVRRTACGRVVLEPSATTVRWTADQDLVTCGACRRAMGLHGNGQAPSITDFLPQSPLQEAPAPKHVPVVLSDAQLDLLGHLVAMEQESLDEYQADKILTDAQRVVYEAELNELDKILALALRVARR